LPIDEHAQILMTKVPVDVIECRGETVVLRKPPFFNRQLNTVIDKYSFSSREQYAYSSLSVENEVLN